MPQTIVNLVLTLVLIVGIAYAATTSEATSDDVDRNSVAPSSTSSQPTNNELSSLPGNLLSILANGGSVVAGLLALAAMAMLVMPLFGIRMCSIVGGCDPYQTYNDAYSSGGYSQTSFYPTANTYGKRSIEYIGPILKALSSAYDKYGKMNVAPTSAKKS